MISVCGTFDRFIDGILFENSRVDQPSCVGNLMIH